MEGPNASLISPAIPSCPTHLARTIFAHLIHSTPTQASISPPTCTCSKFYTVLLPASPPVLSPPFPCKSFPALNIHPTRPPSRSPRCDTSSTPCPPEDDSVHASNPSSATRATCPSQPGGSTKRRYSKAYRELGDGGLVGLPGVKCMLALAPFLERPTSNLHCSRKVSSIGCRSTCDLVA